MSNEPKDGREKHEEGAAKVYDQNAVTPLPERKGEFYSYNPAAEVVNQRSTELFTQTGMGMADQRQLQETFRGIQKATGLPDTVLAQIADGHIDNLLAETRVSDDPDGDALAHDQQIAAWSTESRDEFVRQHGKRDGEALLERTQRFVRKYPALAKLLQQRGLGSRPEIVRGIASHVFSTGWRG